MINEKHDKNFFLYINEFRIREAQKMMSDKNNTEMSILRIAYEIGFNSKATFNRMFKTVTGLTPTEYRRRCSAFVFFSDKKPYMMRDCLQNI